MLTITGLPSPGFTIPAGDGIDVDGVSCNQVEALQE
jgi:hypothetical protein